MDAQEAARIQNRLQLAGYACQFDEPAKVVVAQDSITVTSGSRRWVENDSVRIRDYRSAVRFVHERE